LITAQLGLNSVETIDLVEKVVDKSLKAMWLLILTFTAVNFYVFSYSQILAANPEECHYFGIRIWNTSTIVERFI